MINIQNFRHVLLELGFRKYLNIYTATFNGTQMKVDFEKELLVYPDSIKGGRDTTKDFHQNENFVVFECVCSLLKKGYLPQNIELEASAGVEGRGQNNTYLDILVKDNIGNNYLIIECKTPGKEFDSAWKKVLRNGGQLFNYFTLFRTPYLCLYASDFSSSCIQRFSNIILFEDVPSYLDETHKTGYRDLGQNANQNDYFAIWSDTYEKSFLTQGIFEKNAHAYEISQKITLSFDDLTEIHNYEMIQHKYHEFATIMRQHNISGRENAFDKLVNLFLAKIVDEEKHKDNLLFYWKGIAFDNYYNFQDRLQQLYTEGMHDYLGEEVSYINEDKIIAAFALFKNDPDATKETIINYFREQKFYSNNDFSFLDVHNKQLFLQNTIILIKVVQMLQDIRLKTEEQNQFLGDLFEGFLDQGIKQSEGQFFTPMPIVKFLVSSLPVERIIKDSPEIPKAIDYACGAGHFLNEYANCLKTFSKEKGRSEKEYYKQIYGIEKEYRLSKVAKVSAFMYGQDDIQIIYADALSSNARIENGTFHVLVANPPYSVKGFLETLTDENLSGYELTKEVSDPSRNNAIEAFFVERAAQLLKSEGVAAIILPSSLLSNGNIYIKCREILLRCFDIIAIAEFGSGTFGKTGTNTVTLFLRRKSSAPDISVHFKNRTDTWFNGDFSKDSIFLDARHIDDYCLHCGIDAGEYRAWLSGGPVPHAAIFNEYRTAAENMTAAKNIRKKRITEKYTAKDQEADLASFISDVQKKTEKEKLYYFLLASDNPQNVLICKAPSDTRANKEFLGYEWSGAKGNEGIKYLGVSVHDEEDQLSKNKGIKNIRTPLFDPNDYNNPQKINTFIRSNFTGQAMDIPLELSPYLSSARLVDMLDFGRVEFDKAIKINVRKSTKPQSRWQQIKLGELAPEIKKGTSITQRQTVAGDYKVVAGGIDFAYTHSQYNREENTITISASGANAGFVNFWDEKIFASDCTTIRAASALETKYLYHYLKSIQDELYLLAKGAAQPHVYPEDIKSILIPFPDFEIRRQIVAECDEIDMEYKTKKEEKERASQKISEKMDALLEKAEQLYKLSNTDNFYVTIGRRVLNTETDSSFEIPVYSANVFEPFGFIDKLLFDDFSAPSVVWGIDGDWQVNCFPAGMKFYPTDHCGVIRIKTPEILPKYLAYALKKEGEALGFKRSYRASTDRISAISLKVPPLAEQQQTILEVEKLEQQISEAQAVLQTCAARKQDVVTKYLR